MLDSNAPEMDYDKMSAKQLTEVITMHAKSPLIDMLLGTLTQKIKSDFAEQLEADKRGRSTVISGLPESADGTNQAVRLAGSLGQRI
ncbi:hypothetical protein Y032_0420g1150 [Ancylostoma ceylanicum]|uniref:Uncharacterized protein n=1 Tax=Ancylostoma ceylanicum TaxID=53326 RepID=A0A016X1G4_9BILA|nr:hypothetical protein Y032_0420g1150 [Ancylostoma ceylanicum]